MKPATPNNPVLYIFSGLPGTGKTTLSQMLARRLKCVHLRIDTIEQALRELCAIDVQGEGYRLAYRIAADNLRLGLSVIADSCNPIELTRREWEQVAVEAHARYVNIEVICSNVDEHRRRVESRGADLEGAGCVSWRDVEKRDYDGWTVERVVIDTSNEDATRCLNELEVALSTLV